MARLTQFQGQAYLVDGDQVIPLSPERYEQEIAAMREARDMPALQKLAVGAGRGYGRMVSGAQQLFGGEETAQQALAQQMQQEQGYRGMERYGGILPDIGEFAASASTAFIPSGLPGQVGIGALQGAVENPDSPYTSGAIGAGATIVGDWVGDTLGRMVARMRGTRESLQRGASPNVQRAEGMGFEFTPAQRTGDPARRIMEKELAKNPLFAGIDAERFIRNQARLNDTAANYLGVPPTGRMTGEMLGQAYQQAKQGFKAMDNYDGQIAIDPDQLVTVWEDMTQPAQALMNQFARKYSNVLDGPVSGKEWSQARNWLADQSRRTANQKLGIADEIQGIIGVLDEGAVNSVDDVTAAAVDRARNQWKSMLVIEASQGGAEAKAAGDVNPLSAYRALEKYYGRSFRHGRFRDPFADAVRGMAAAGDVAPPPRPSGGGPSAFNIPELLNRKLLQEPAVRGYMRGDSPLSEYLLGMSLEEAPAAASPLGIGAARGLMANENDTP